MEAVLIFPLLLSMADGYLTQHEDPRSEILLQTVDNVTKSFLENVEKVGPTAIIIQEKEISAFTESIFIRIHMNEKFHDVILVNLQLRGGKFESEYSIVGIRPVFWIIDNVDEIFWSISNYTDTKLWDSNAYIFLVITSLKVSFVSLQNVFLKLFENIYITNLIIIANVIDTEENININISALSYNPYYPGGLIINFNTENLFTNKMINMYGFKLQVAVQNQMDTLYKNIEKNKNYKGTWLEHCLLSLILEQINATPQVFSPESDTYFSDLYYQPISKRPVILGSANLITEENMRYSCWPHEQQCARLIVPKALRIPQYLNLVLPFTIMTWVAFVTCIPFTVILWKIIKQDFSLEHWTITEVLRLLFIGNADWTPVSFKHRIFLLSCLYYSIIVMNSYAGSITSYLTVPQYYKDLDTLEDLYDSVLPIYLHAQVKSDSIINALISEMGSDNDDMLIKLIPQVQIEPLPAKQVLDMTAFHRNASFFTADYIAKIFTNLDIYYNKGYPLLYTMRDCPLLLLIIFEMPFSSPLRDRGDIVTRRLYEHGFRTKIDRETELQVTLSAGVNHHKSMTLKPLQIEHVQLAFFLLFIGICLCCIIICIENLFKKFEHANHLHYSYHS